MEIHHFTSDGTSSLLRKGVNWVGLFRLLKGLSRMLGNSQVRLRSPRGPAKVLLKVVEHNPTAIIEAIQQ